MSSFKIEKKPAKAEVPKAAEAHTKLKIKLLGGNSETTIDQLACILINSLCFKTTTYTLELISVLLALDSGTFTKGEFKAETKVHLRFEGVKQGVTSKCSGSFDANFSILSFDYQCDMKPCKNGSTTDELQKHIKSPVLRRLFP